MKILQIIGARPQFVKAAVVTRSIQQKGLETVIVHTGQHYDYNMSDIFFEELELPTPKYNLGIGACGHGAMTGRMMEKIEELLIEEKPDWVMVYGDTNSTLAGAISAAKLHIPVAHVEAGLRSFNREMPEELNRLLTDHCSDLLLVPNQSAAAHLHQEGISPSKICECGDVMYDASLYYRKKVNGSMDLLTPLGLNSKEYALVTVHRAENTDEDERLHSIVDSLIDLTKTLPVLVPLHPRTRAALTRIGRLEEVESSLHVIDPVGYLEMVYLENHAKLIVTDSGGVQKEAYFFQVPCVILRDQTEWVELVDEGYHRLLKVGKEDLVEACQQLLGATFKWDRALYGKGDAGDRMIASLVEAANGK